MLRNYSKSTTITAQSAVTVEENGQEKQVPVAYMNANLDSAGGVNITKTIQNKELYAANKEAVRADFVAFEEKVYKEQDSGVTE